MYLLPEESATDIGLWVNEDKTKVMVQARRTSNLSSKPLEVWTIIQKTMNKLDTLERQILRKIHGPVKKFSTHKDTEEW